MFTKISTTLLVLRFHLLVEIKLSLDFVIYHPCSSYSWSNMYSATQWNHHNYCCHYTTVYNLHSLTADLNSGNGCHNEIGSPYSLVCEILKNIMWIIRAK